MAKVLMVSDTGIPSGYGRIADSVGVRLVQRGYQVFAAGLQYDGLLPAAYENARLPYEHVASLGGHADWPSRLAMLINVYAPDVVLVIQDAPYLEQVRGLPVDWSRIAFVGITPVDGVPIWPNWINLFKLADGMLTISEFGVKAHAEAGVHSLLCRPAADPQVFRRLPQEERAALRQAVGIDAGAFVVGSCAQNQGRKCWPSMLEGFFKATADLPTARFIAITEKTSLAGWDLPTLCDQMQWDKSKILWRGDEQLAAADSLTKLYNLLDVHVVLAHREGFGLPITEAQLCGVLNMAMDYTSGTEQCGDGHGVLIKPIDYRNPSSWGNSYDLFPDTADYAKQLRFYHDNPIGRAAVAERGRQYAASFTWDKATDNVQQVIEQAIDSKRPIVAPQSPTAPVLARMMLDSSQDADKSNLPPAMPQETHVASPDKDYPALDPKYLKQASGYIADVGVLPLDSGFGG